MSVAVYENGVSGTITTSPTEGIMSRQDPRTLTNLNEILSCLSSFQSEEAELSNSLTELLSAREPIVASLSRLQSLVPHLDELHLEASMLSEKVSSTAQTADRVGGKVRSLDEEMRRVRESAERVGQVMELKSTLVSLQSSIDSQDWESATRHCARAMSLPGEVISGAFAEATVPTTESHLPPSQTLQGAREQLLTIFQHQFEQASRSRDAATTSRFFKLFPVIGWEAEGLHAYADFVVDLIRVKAPGTAKTSSPLYYITALTALFESVAMIVDQHQPVVEKYYGSGKMSSVIECLLDECDRVVKKLLDGWEEDRGVKRKLSNVSSSVFSNTISSTARRPANQSNLVDEDILDPREVDKTLTELTGLTGRWSLFKKFLMEQLREEYQDSDDNDREIPSKTSSIPVPEATQTQVGAKPLDPGAIKTKLIESTASYRLFEELLKTYYIPLEVWYIRTTVEKAHRLSQPDLSQSPATTTTPDDVFYILKLVYTRVLSTGSVNTLERMSERLRDIMDGDYNGVIKRKLDDVYRNAGNVSAGRNDKVERENRIAFLILLNDLDISSSHMDRLVKDLSTHPSIPQHYNEYEYEMVKSTISSLSGLVPKFRSTIRAGVEQLFNQLMRPKLRTLVQDVYKDVSYVLDEDNYSAAEYQDVVRKRFVKSWESLADGYKDTFSESNYRLIFGLALDVLLRPWEKYVMGLKFTELGAIRFDRDIRSVTTYLSSQTAFGDVREKFTRLQQMSTLLNLDNEEDVDEFYGGSGINWVLTIQEARGVTGLKL